jgi:hypothetical protein
MIKGLSKHTGSSHRGFIFLAVSAGLYLITSVPAYAYQETCSWVSPPSASAGSWSNGGTFNEYSYMTCSGDDSGGGNGTTPSVTLVSSSDAIVIHVWGVDTKGYSQTISAWYQWSTSSSTPTISSASNPGAGWIQIFNDSTTQSTSGSELSTTTLTLGSASGITAVTGSTYYLFVYSYTQGAGRNETGTSPAYSYIMPLPPTIQVTVSPAAQSSGYTLSSSSITLSYTISGGVSQTAPTAYYCWSTTPITSMADCDPTAFPSGQTLPALPYPAGTSSSILGTSPYNTYVVLGRTGGHMTIQSGQDNGSGGVSLQGSSSLQTDQPVYVAAWANIGDATSTVTTSGPLYIPPLTATVTPVIPPTNVYTPAIVAFASMTLTASDSLAISSITNLTNWALPASCNSSDITTQLYNGSISPANLVASASAGTNNLTGLNIQFSPGQTQTFLVAALISSNCVSGTLALNAPVVPSNGLTSDFDLTYYSGFQAQNWLSSTFNTNPTATIAGNNNISFIVSPAAIDAFGNILWISSATTITVTANDPHNPFSTTNDATVLKAGWFLYDLNGSSADCRGVPLPDTSIQAVQNALGYGTNNPALSNNNQTDSTTLPIPQDGILQDAPSGCVHLNATVIDSAGGTASISQPYWIDTTGPTVYYKITSLINGTTDYTIGQNGQNCAGK